MKAETNEHKESGPMREGDREDHIYRSDLRVHFLIKGILLTKGIGTMKELICQEFDQKYGIRPIKEDIYLKKCSNGSMTAYVGFLHDYEAYKVLTSEARIQLPLVGKKGEIGIPQCEITELFKVLLTKIEPELKKQVSKMNVMPKSRAENKEYQRWKYSRDYTRHLSHSRDRSKSYERRRNNYRSRSRSYRRAGSYEKNRGRSRSRDNSYDKRRHQSHKYEEHRDESNKKAYGADDKKREERSGGQKLEENKEVSGQAEKISREDSKSDYCCYLINIPKDVDERQVRQEFDKLKLPHPKELLFTQQSMVW